MKTIKITKELLDQAEALNRAHPCTGVLARNAVGGSVPPTHPSACGWCAVGAVCKVAGFDKRPDIDGIKNVEFTHDDAYRYERDRSVLIDPERLDRCWLKLRSLLTDVEITVP